MPKRPKKSPRGKTIPLSAFLQQTPDPPRNSPTAPDGHSLFRALPSAPKSSLDDGEKSPKRPPLALNILKLPYGTKEEDLKEFFVGHNDQIQIRDVKVSPSRRGRTLGRVFGRVKFENGASLRMAIEVCEKFKLVNRMVKVDNTEEGQWRREGRSSSWPSTSRL